MIGSWCRVLLPLALILPHGVAAESGGRNVTVALFTTLELRSVVVTPLLPGAWTASCRACAHVPLTHALVVSTGKVFMGGSLRIADSADAAVTATATGLWQIRAYTHGVDVVLTIPSERYTAAVVSAEAAANEPQESLRALAIVARTYALNGPHYNARNTHLPADLCDSTECQAVRLGPVADTVKDAVSTTAGETLWFKGTRAEVFFSQHCGGMTADASEAWASAGSTRKTPYLRSHADMYCLRRGTAEWHASVSLEELRAVAQQEGWHLPRRIVQVSVVKRSGSGRVARLVVRGVDGKSSPLSASALRFGVGRSLGWNRIRSDLYDIAVRDGALVFDGRGHGHGVGLCQAGATGMAAEHQDARAILAFYFPGTRVSITSKDDGWMETRVGAVRVRSIAEVSNETSDEVARAWQSSLRRFPLMKGPKPLVIFAPSTEMYRQMTGQPGWDLASTRGEVVTLQPQRLLRASLRGEQHTLRHEFLHVLIEGEATDQAPLWLREGLAQTLTGDAFPNGPTKSGAEMDATLQSAKTLGAAQDAHRAAGAYVHGLIERYGLLAVRGWLRSGVPASVASGK